MNKLLPKAVVGTDDGTAGLGPSMCIQQGHGVVFHEIGKAEGCRSAHSCGTVHQCAAIPHFDAVDVISYGVEKVIEVGIGSIAYRHLHVLNVFKECVHYFYRGVDNRGDVVVGQSEFVVSDQSITDKKAASYLREAINIIMLDSLRRKETRCCCHQGVRSAVSLH